MYTSMTALALASFVASAGADGPTWHRDYGKARAEAARAGKPLVVFLAGNGYARAVTGEALGPEAGRILARDYVCVFADTQTSEGRALARRFQLTNGSGLVISDRSGAKQAYWHDGPISPAELTSRLKKYADPAVVVATTETNLQPTAAGAAYSPVIPAQTFAPAYSPVWSGSFCPGGR
ncbi:MAG TPA: hypothetical protein VIL46_01955 [Gemmataceae bacterium]